MKKNKPSFKTVLSKRETVSKFIEYLLQTYPDAEVELDYHSPLELMVATILSAQCTDKRVNIVTKTLFRKYRRVEDYLSADPSTLEDEIKSTGFFRQKTKAIIQCCQYIHENNADRIPETMDELVKMPGIGRKTASVILANGFGIPAIAVDTHVIRISNRWGLVKTKDPEKIEFSLRKLVPEKLWGFFSNSVILHGRRCCKARKPLCAECAVTHLCSYYADQERQEH